MRHENSIHQTVTLVCDQWILVTDPTAIDHLKNADFSRFWYNMSPCNNSAIECPYAHCLIQVRYQCDKTVTGKVGRTIHNYSISVESCGHSDSNQIQTAILSVANFLFIWLP